jgi:hypothetical protein
MTRLVTEELLDEALRSGNYKRSTPWTELYIRFKTDNIYLYVRKELDEDYLKTVLAVFVNLDVEIWQYDLKKCIGAYLLSLICVPPNPLFFTKNTAPNTLQYRKV